MCIRDRHCDVLSGYPKHIGMQHALRALAPDVIVCDEVGAMEDIAAITQAANAGVGLVVTIQMCIRDRSNTMRFATVSRRRMPFAAAWTTMT